MKYSKKILLLSLLAITLLNACGKQKTSQSAQSNVKDDDYGKSIVINEIMAANYSGLQDKDGQLYDWIEVQNISDKEVNLEGYSLITEKDGKEEKKGKEAKKDKKGEKATPADSTTTKQKKWDFPETVLKPGQCVVVFASKKKGEAAGNTLHANFKMSAKKGKVSLLSPRGTVMSDMSYDHLLADQVCRRLADGTIEKSYLQSPGYDNTQQGYEAYLTAMDKQRTSKLRIWELMPKPGENGNAWVELKNTSSDTIDLAQYSLSDKPDKLQKWNLPSKKLVPGELYVVQFAGRKAQASNPTMARFKLDDCETVILAHNGKFADGACAKPAYYGLSMGRKAGKSGFYFFPTPSRGQENSGAAYRFIAPQPVFVPAPGVYNKDSIMTIRLQTNGRTVHYTTNGSTPTKQSAIYKDSIRITSTTVIRAYAEGDTSSVPSSTATATYFLGEKHTLPVVSVAMNESDLYGHTTGIYADGPGKSATFPHLGANFWKRWEKNAHIEFYDGKEGFDADCGIRIFGGYSRALPKKSFRIQFRSRYGNSNLSYDYFDQGKDMKLKSFILRTGSQDDFGVNVSDEFFTILMAEQCPDLLIQAYRPVVLYVNGSYFGVYFMREKFNEHFVGRHLNVSPDSAITVIMSKYAEKGRMADFTALRNYCSSHNMAEKQHYDYVTQRIDCQGLIDLTLGQLYSGNTDVGNIRYVRSSDPAGDQKWHWVFYDLDSSWLGYMGANFYLNKSSATCMQSLFVTQLLKNKEFRKLFLERLSHHLHHTFAPDHAQAVFDAIIATVKPEMKRNFKRWPQTTYEQWESRVARFREKFPSRPAALLNDLRKYLNITAEEEKQYFSDLGY